MKRVKEEIIFHLHFFGVLDATICLFVNPYPHDLQNVFFPTGGRGEHSAPTMVTILIELCIMQSSDARIICVSVSTKLNL